MFDAIRYKNVRKELEHPIYFELFDYINQIYLLQTRYLILISPNEKWKRSTLFCKSVKGRNNQLFHYKLYHMVLPLKCGLFPRKIMTLRKRFCDIPGANRVDSIVSDKVGVYSLSVKYIIILILPWRNQDALQKFN